MAVLSSSVEFAWQAAENLSEGGVVRLLMTALQQLECLLMTTFPRTERLLMTILCSACQCFFLLCLFQLIFILFILHQHVIVGLRPDLCCLSLIHSMLPNQTKFACFCRSCYNCWSMFWHVCHFCYLCFSKLLHVVVKVVKCICQSCCMHLSRFVHIFLTLWQTKPCLNLKKIFKIDRPSAVGWRLNSVRPFFPMLQFASLHNFTVFFMQISLRLFEDENNHWTNLLSF